MGQKRIHPGMSFHNTNIEAARPVQVWRPASSGALFMAGRTSSYDIEPAGQWVIGALTSGSMDSFAGKTEQSFRAGDLCIWNGEGRHSGVSPTGWTACLVMLDPGFSAVLQPSLTHLRQHRELHAAFVRLHAESGNAAADGWTDADVLDWLLAVEQLQAGDATPSRHAPCRAVTLARQLLDDRLAETVTLDDLAAAAGENRFTLAKLFRRELGVSPHRYLIARRLAAAQQNLAAGASIAEAALAAGFFDQSHLTRQFTRRTGFTPARFVRALRR